MNKLFPLLFLVFTSVFLGNLKMPFIIPQKVDISQNFVYPEKVPVINTQMMFKCGDKIFLREGDDLPEIIFKVDHDCHVFLFHINTRGEYLLIWPSSTVNSFLKKDEIKKIGGNYTLYGKYCGIEYFQLFLFEKLNQKLKDDIESMLSFSGKNEYSCNLPFHNDEYMDYLEKSGVSWNLNTISYDYNLNYEKTVKFVENKTGNLFFINGRAYTNSEEQVIMLREKQDYLTFYQDNKKNSLIIDDHNPEKSIKIGD